MLSWVLINAVLTALALGFAGFAHEAPHRLRFHACLLALVAWLVPWPVVGSWMPAIGSVALWQAEQQWMVGTAQATQLPLLVIDTRGVPLADGVLLVHPALMALLAAFAIGAALLCRRLYLHAIQLQRLQREAVDAGHLWQRHGIAVDLPLWQQSSIAGAFTSGIRRPAIWIHEDLVDSPALATVLRHELTHVRQHDNLWLLLITLVDSLLWWNPLVAWLSRWARELQELSCDERCHAEATDYPAQLAQLMLDHVGLSRSPASEPLSMSANIFTLPSFNMQRLRMLQRSPHMKTRHLVAAIATATLGLTTVAFVSAQPDAATPAAPGKRVIITRVADKQQLDTAGLTVDQDANIVIVEADEGAIPQVGGVVSFGDEGATGVLIAKLRFVGDQFMNVSQQGDALQVSFSFTEATLPFALGPLANMLAGSPPFAMGGGQGVAAATPGRVMQFKLAAPANGAPGAELDLPISPALIIEDESARERQVTVSGENLSLADAIAKIAEASNCNIFKDDKTIVVDYCEAQ